jgi:lipopolysaccharide export LptBFGC system permease protein LptF
MVLRLMRLALLLAVANAGWITPAANTAYRNIVAGAETFRGVNELTFIELGQRVYQGSPGGALDGPLPMVFWLNARLALAIAPVLLGVLALAGATAVRRRSSAIIVFTTLAVFVGCYVLLPDYDIAIVTRWLPAAAIAWIPNVIVALATVQSYALKRSVP